MVSLSEAIENQKAKWLLKLKIEFGLIEVHKKVFPNVFSIQFDCA